MLVSNVFDFISVSPNMYRKNFSSAKNLTDVELITGVERGVLKSMEVLYHKYCKSLSYYIEHRLNDKAQRLNILKTVFLEIWQGKEKWDRQHPVIVFMFSIVKRKIDKVNILSGENPSQDESSDLGEKKLKAKSNTTFLRDKLKSLPSELNSLIHMMYEEALTYEQIAIIENCSVDTIEQRFLRAMTLLKTDVSQH